MSSGSSHSVKSLAVTVLLVFLVILGLQVLSQQLLGWSPHSKLKALIDIAVAVVVTAWRHP